LVEQFASSPSFILDAVVITCNVIEFILTEGMPGVLNHQLGSVLVALKAILFYRIIKYYPFAIKMMTIARNTLPSYLNLSFLMFMLIFVSGFLG
jgi:hypothetical protein